MSFPVNLRVATSDDVDFLARVVLEANESRYAANPDWDQDAFRRGLLVDSAEQVTGRVPGSTTYVVEVDDPPAGGQRVGRLRLVRSDRVLEIAEATRSGALVELEVEDDNPDAHRLYTRLGFRPAPAVPGAQPDRTRMVHTTPPDFR